MSRFESAIGFADAAEIGPLTEQQVRTLESRLTEELGRLIPRSRAGLNVTLAELGRHEVLDAAVRDLPIASRRKIRAVIAARGNSRDRLMSAVQSARPVGDSFSRLSNVR